MYRVRYQFDRPFAYIHNRWIVPKHKVIITDPRFGIGQYHDLDYVMLHALFQMVVDYIEIECAALNEGFQTPRQKVQFWIYDLPIINWFFPYPRNIRRGLHYLRWAMKLKNDPVDAERGGIEQSQFAEDMFRLYTFWKHERPCRIDPNGLYIAHRGEQGWKRPMTDIDRVLMEESDALECAYQAQDTMMLTLIIKHRNRMWT